MAFGWGGVGTRRPKADKKGGGGWGGAPPRKSGGVGGGGGSPPQNKFGIKSPSGDLVPNR